MFIIYEPGVNPKVYVNSVYLATHVKSYRGLYIEYNMKLGRFITCRFRKNYMSLL